MTALDYFRDKVVCVAGATLPLGMSLCHRLADLGATVIALDLDDMLLASVARHAPGRIEPLPLDLSDPARVALLARAWDGEPVQALFNLMPLSQPPEAVIGLFDALGPGLEAGAARSLSFIPELPPQPTPIEAVTGGGWRGLFDHLPVPGAHHRVLSVDAGVHAPGETMTDMGDLALMLCHPVADALGDHSRLRARPLD